MKYFPAMPGADTFSCSGIHPMVTKAKIIHIYNTYTMIMSAVKRIPVTEPVWKELSEMRTAGQTYTELLEELMESRKKDRLAADMKRIEEEGTFVPLSEIRD